MATITNFAQATTAGAMSTRMWKPTSTLLSTEIDFADVLRFKGSAVAAADVINVWNFPAGTFVHFAGIQTITADDATTLTLDLGYTGGDTDGWVDGYDQAAAAAGAYATTLWDATEDEVFLTTATTLAVLIATLTGTLTVGKIRVFALVTDINGNKPGFLAQVGS